MTERDALIEANQEALTRAVGAFLRGRPNYAYLEDDLKSGANAKLVQAVDMFLDGEVDCLKAYLRMAFWTSFWDVIRLEEPIKTRRGNAPKRTQMVDVEAPAPGDSLGDLINDACTDDVDRLLAGLLLAGKSEKQIAQELELPQSEVVARKAMMGRRLRNPQC